METDEVVLDGGNEDETDRVWNWFLVVCAIVSVVAITFSAQDMMFFFRVLSMINSFAV